MKYLMVAPPWKGLTPYGLGQPYTVKRAPELEPSICRETIVTVPRTGKSDWTSRARHCVSPPNCHHLLPSVLYLEWDQMLQSARDAGIDLDDTQRNELHKVLALFLHKG